MIKKKIHISIKCSKFRLKFSINTFNIKCMGRMEYAVYGYEFCKGWYSAPAVSAERLKKYVLHKIFSEVPDGPFCIVYIHTSTQNEYNSPGMSILRWIYEEIPFDAKDRLQVVYFIHPGLLSRLVFATLGRLLLSGG